MAHEFEANMIDEFDAGDTEEITGNHGIMDDGSPAPVNSDTARLDWFSIHPGKVKNLNGGVLATDINTLWQPSVRAAIDAAMEYMRRGMRANGLKPKW